MKVTAFGKFLRRLRIDHEMLLKDMADKLGVSSAYLSSLELGKKPIPNNFDQKIIDTFSIKNGEADELRQAASISQPSVKIDLVGKTTGDREMVMSFARRYESLSEENKQKLKKLLGE